MLIQISKRFNYLLKISNFFPLLVSSISVRNFTVHTNQLQKVSLDFPHKLFHNLTNKWHDHILRYLHSLTTHESFLFFYFLLAELEALKNSCEKWILWVESFAYLETNQSQKSSCVKAKRRTNYMKREETQEKKKLSDYEMACLRHICFSTESCWTFYFFDFRAFRFCLVSVNVFHKKFNATLDESKAHKIVRFSK